MSIYTPDAWVVIDITTPTYSVRKILAGWYGGYGGGDSWKLSSGVTAVNEFPDRYEFINESGSIYVCYKTIQRLTGLTGSMLASWQRTAAEADENSPDHVTIAIVEWPEAAGS